jgi:uncharacterized coiled-coil protein SlyX
MSSQCQCHQKELRVVTMFGPIILKKLWRKIICCLSFPNSMSNDGFSGKTSDDEGSDVLAPSSVKSIQSLVHSNSSADFLNALGMGISISSGSSPNFRRMANDLKIVLADIVSFKPSLPEGSTTNSERILHGIIHSLESCADDYSSVENRVSSLVLDLKKEVEKRETLQALVTIHEITLASHETTLASHETTLASLETTLASHETTLASHEKGGVELGRRIKDLESQRTRLETTIKALSAKEADSVAINHIMDYMHLMKNFIMRIEMKSGAYLKS